jgi:hypothetical protein
VTGVPGRRWRLRRCHWDHLVATRCTRLRRAGDRHGVIWWRPAAPGFAALAIATGIIWWRPAAPGFAALANRHGVIWWRPAAPGFAALAIATG